VEYRPMTDQDLAAVVNIQERITRAPVTDRWREMLAKHVGNKHRPAIVADKDGQVIGFIFGEVKIGGFGAEISGILELVGVTPEHMGAGIGRALAEALLDYFRTQGVEDVLSSVMWDSGDMLAFFKNLGFDRSPYINLKLKLAKA
jgi:ribosomal protein S18 acetylase RimI-like enzyme